MTASPVPALSPYALDPDNQQRLLDLANTTADPATVALWLGNFAATHQDHPQHRETLSRALSRPDWCKRVVLAVGNSPYLAHVLHKWPEFLAEFLAHGPESRRAEQREALLTAVLANTSREQVATLLRRHKHREFLRIGMLDLAGEAPLEEVTAALTGVGEDCLEAGYQWLEKLLSSRHGTPMVEPPGEAPRPARFVVLGMGKFGARELNFSSDIDLIYLYDHDQGQTDGPRSLSIKNYYVRLGRELAKLMAEYTADGMVFRTDLRLRPEGESGDVALSIRSAELYYESWGQTWERSAMIKARPVAGDTALGEEFLRWIQPFVYRRYLDFAALDAIREMKLKIDAKVAAASATHRNVKLGYGGIREIEFFVQCQQLIHGGRHSALRLRETLPGLKALVRLELLDRDSADFLEQAYVFLRTVEHRLQIVREQQTHTLPVELEELEKLARRLGMSGRDAFEKRFQEVTGRVQQIYQQLFWEGEKQRGQQPRDPMVERLLGCDPATPGCPELLAEAGFRQPQAARPLLTLLREGPSKLGFTENTRRWYHALAAPLLKEILQAPDPDLAASHTLGFLERLGTRSNYLALLVENPPVLQLLVRLFGASPFLSRFLINHPQLMDNLVGRDFLERFRNRSDLSHDLHLLMHEAPDDEARLESIREFKNVEVLRQGLRDLSGLAELTEVMAGLSALADTVLTQVMTEALQQLEARHGPARWSDRDGNRHPAEFAILAMGKLGGGELNYASDLDLIFVHGSQGEEQWTDGERSLSNSQFFAKLGQRIVTGITTMTRSGKLYELDMRLRPSGHSGALVTSLETFRQYQREEAWTWEHQALTRARVVVGDPAISRQLKEEIQAILCQPREREPLRREVREMRERMHQEKKPPEGVLDIKQSRGGIVDVEFLVQFLILAHAAAHPGITQRNVINALSAFRRVGLLTPAECLTLEEAYLFYRLVENRLRLLHDRSENRIDHDSTVRQRLNRLCGLATEEDVTTHLERHFQQVLPIVERHLGN